MIDLIKSIQTNKQTSYKIKKKTIKKIKLKNTRNKMNMNGEKVTYYLIYVHCNWLLSQWWCLWLVYPCMMLSPLVTRTGYSGPCPWRHKYIPLFRTVSPSYIRSRWPCYPNYSYSCFWYSWGHLRGHRTVLEQQNISKFIYLLNKYFAVHARAYARMIIQYNT